MKLFVASLLALSFQASAMNMNFPSVGDFPNESGWAIAMASMACGVDYSRVEGVTGVIVPQSGKSVLYVVYLNSEVIGKAWASSQWISAKKKCL